MAWEPAFDGWTACLHGYQGRTGQQEGTVWPGESQVPHCPEDLQLMRIGQGWKSDLRTGGELPQTVGWVFGFNSLGNRKTPVLFEHENAKAVLWNN